MSEVDARPPPTRGRSSVRGGRGGYGRGGPRGGRKAVNGSLDVANAPDPLEDQGELGQMKKKYAKELLMLKDMFPEWTDTDLVFALQEADGDVPITVDKITQGSVSQFSEVKKPKDRARSKVKEDSTAAGTTDKSTSRGGRGRGGIDSARGGRGRGSDRGRGGSRGGRGGHATTNGAQKDTTAASVPTTESPAWDTTTSAEAATGGSNSGVQEISKEAATESDQSAWNNAGATSEAATAATSDSMKSNLIPEGGPKKSWASMFAQAKPAPAPKQAPVPSQPPLKEPVAPSQVDVVTEEAKEEPEPLPPASLTQEPAVPATSEPTKAEQPGMIDNDDVAITPSKDPLTEENVEHLPDESNPPATQTVASTAGSVDPRNLTPLPAQQPPIGSRPPMGGYAATAYRATGQAGRSSSFQRRVQEQQEAVVMPGHNAVDRAAVQFGSMGLNGDGPDVDEDREEPETQKALQHSPPSQPRTSLPPAPRQGQETAAAENLQAPKQAPGLPPASLQNQQQMQDATMAPGLSQDQQHMNPNFNQYARYAHQPGMQQESGAQQQKPYDPFGHQAQPSQFDQFGGHTQQQQQQTPVGGFGGLSSAPADYSQFYTSNEQNRNTYNQYYGGSSYGPQDARTQMGQHTQQDVQGLGQQRSASSFGSGPNESGYAGQAQQQAQSRFGDAPGSGHNTPNPHMVGQQQAGPNAQQSHSIHQQGPSHQQQAGGYGGGASAGFPYGHPYYQSPYQQAYQNQFGYNHQLGGYGGGFPGKQGGMYGGPQGYGMGSHSSYDQHSSSPANAGAFGQNQTSSMRTASGMTSGLGGGHDDYSRGSTGSQSGFGNVNDPFARSTSGFAGQTSYGQQSMAGPEEPLKPFDNTKSGPSPALGQPGRPGSAANSVAGGTQSSLQPPQGQHTGFGAAGGYPGFPGQGSQYGGALGGLGSHQQGQSAMGGQGGYGGGYGAAGFSQTYGGYGSRGGWASNYGAH
ncbi:hypothetical protein M433DRAFT_368862 [Acidomyces richmondensis BFW]|nr:hypothetical protein M433DRAFT_368862 [Acidomyces richmondensis BFW]